MSRRQRVLGVVLLLTSSTTIGLGWGLYELYLRRAVQHQKAEVPIHGKIAFVSFRLRDDHMPHLWLLEGQEIRHIARGGNPKFLRDGRSLIYPGLKGWTKLDLESGKEEILPIPDWHPFEFDWSPDGEWFCFASSVLDPKRGLAGHNIHMARKDGTGLRVLTNFPPYDETFGVQNPTWSPDGKKILFSAFDPNEPRGGRHMYFWIIQADGSNLQKIPLPLSLNNTIEPAWSPDGKKIAFIATPENERDADYELYICDADGSNVRRLTFNDWNEREPVFSPDGKQICFVSYRHWTMGMAGYGSELFLIDVDGTNERRLTPPQKVPHRRSRGGWSDDLGPDWAPQW